MTSYDNLFLVHKYLVEKSTKFTHIISSQLTESSEVTKSEIGQHEGGQFIDRKPVKQTQSICIKWCWYGQNIIKILDFICDIDHTVSASIVTLGLCTVWPDPSSNLQTQTW